jgi:hypothetical protein
MLVSVIEYCWSDCHASSRWRLGSIRTFDGTSGGLLGRNPARLRSPVTADT